MKQPFFPRTQLNNNCEYSSILLLSNFIFFPRHKVWWQLDNKNHTQELYSPKDISGCSYLYLVSSNTFLEVLLYKGFDYCFLSNKNKFWSTFLWRISTLHHLSHLLQQNLKISRDIKFFLKTNLALV